MRFSNQKITNKIEKTAENFLIVQGRFLKADEIMQYHRKQGATKEKITSDIIDNNLCKLFLHKTVTTQHPIDNKGLYTFVNSSNVQKEKIGTVIDAFIEETEDGKYLSGKLQIEREDCVNRILKAVEENKNIDISASYESVNIQTGEDTYNQTNIMPNHVAILFDEAGRAGPDVHMVFNHNDYKEDNNLGGNMEKIKYKGKEYDQSEVIQMLVEQESSINTLTTDLATMTTNYNTAQTNYTNEKTAHDEITEKFNTLTTEIEDVRKNFNTMKDANSVVKYKTEASQFINADMSKMNAKEIMTEVIKLAQPNFNSADTDTIESLTPIYEFTKSILANAGAGIATGTNTEKDINNINFNSQDGEAALKASQDALDAYFAKGGKE